MYLDVTLHIVPLPGWGGSAGVGLMTVEQGSEQGVGRKDEY